MSHIKNITRDQKIIIKEMLDKKFGLFKISEALKLPYEKVRIEIYANGGKENYDPNSPSRNGKSRITFQERKLIQEMISQEKSNLDIASAVNRARSTIVDEVLRNGGREKYSAEEAHRRSESCMHESQDTKIYLDENQQKIIEMIQQGIGTQKIADTLQVSKRRILIFKNFHEPFMALENRICAIESQLEILFEIINKMEKKND
jgi:hypothetical protein